MIGGSLGRRAPTFSGELDVEDSPDRYGYPFEWHGREFRPVPTSWLIHDRVDPTARATLWLAASAAFDPRLDQVVVRYGPADTDLDQVRVQHFDPAGPDDAQYSRPLESGRWRAILFPSSFQPRDDWGWSA